MATFSDCPACLGGNHAGHVEHWGKRMPGIIDGDFCRCLGDCAKRSSEWFTNLLKRASTEVLSPDAQDLLNKLQSPDGATRDAAIRRVNALMDADPLPLSRTGLQDVREAVMLTLCECGHPLHEGGECGEVLGYDHLNGDHECGCVEHDPACRRRERHTAYAFLGMPRVYGCDDEAPHDWHEFVDDFGIRWQCPGICGGECGIRTGGDSDD